MSSVSSLNSLLASSATPSTIDLGSILAAATGASSAGIDVNAAVASGVYAARATERLWQSQQATLTSQTTALNALDTAVTNISTDLQSLNSLSGPLSSRAVTSSDSTMVTASAASATAVGNHVVMVSNLAQTAAWYSNAFSADPTTQLPADSFTITSLSGTATIDVGNITGVNTLQDVADAINAQKVTLGVTAGVITDTSGSRLAIVSNSPGGATDFTVSSTAPTTTKSWTSASVADATTVLPAGSFPLIFSGGSGSPTTTTITITSTDTLTSVADKINMQNLGVTASAVTDSNGAHLAIATTTGTFVVGNDPIGFGFTQAIKGVDASLTVDGIPITSATNTVKGTVSGLTLNLQNAYPGYQVNITIAPDTTKLTSAITKFVSDYNTAIGQVNSQFAFSGTGQGVLASDPTMRSLQNTLLGGLSYLYDPTPGTTPAIATLHDLGITMANDGTLSVDTTTLNSVVQNNFSDVQNFFQGTALNGFAHTIDLQLNSFTSAANGAFTVDLSSISSSNSDLQNHIIDFEANYINPLQIRLQSQLSQAEILLQQLPQQMNQINTQLGYNTKSGG